MSLTAAVVIPEDDAPLAGGDPVVDSLVARLHAEFGLDPAHLRRLAVEVLGGFATARVQTFVPILAEKRLRQTCRELTPRDR
ncbi:three-helix bundle dimerization domain-containing protein [Petropleomorpha daqingensis]|uniref:Uncharacterized protein n=1 Tax=Petropleomorpha daqingensis TaxID=2026353 RepID=A0A853CJN9_9ACTN|nr:hypothetical protein [Petropleomorpha daqingensis]NYJ07576.1 hypothetical protein [Petropleomorpha daqingensis]